MLISNRVIPLIVVLVTVAFGHGSGLAQEPRPQLIPTEKSIRLFQGRVEKNPKDYLSLTMLGRLYMRQAKEADDFSAFAKAEEAFQSALKVNPTHTTAKAFLAATYASQHKFKAAMEMCEAVLKENPGHTPALATLGDAALEMGDYEKAEQSFERLIKLEKSPPVLVRLARIRELKGETDSALELLQSALKQHREAAGLKTTEAWYEWRIGTFLFTLGQIDEAAAHFRGALDAVPDDAQALVGLASTQAAKGQFRDAIATYERAIEASPEPPFLAALGDVYAKAGDLAKAKEYLDRAEAGMAEEAKDPDSASAHRREVALFFLDHDRQLDKALELARKDHADRQDIYASDALAWALYKNGQLEEAKKAITDALRLGTKDARLHYHAGMIYLKLGEEATAREHLRLALKINPAFSLSGSDEAKAILDDSEQ